MHRAGPDRSSTETAAAVQSAPVAHPGGSVEHAVEGGTDAAPARGGRGRLGLVLMAASFLPFFVAVALAAAIGEDRDDIVWPIVLLYGLSVALWYVGLAVGGAALVSRIRRRRGGAARRAS